MGSEAGGPWSYGGWFCSSVEWYMRYKADCPDAWRMKVTMPGLEKREWGSDTDVDENARRLPCMGRIMAAIPSLSPHAGAGVE